MHFPEGLEVRLDIVAPGRVPLMWCLIAFILTFFITRTITRYIRDTSQDSGGEAKPHKWW